MPQPAIDDLPYIEWIEPDTGETVRLYGDVNKDEAIELPAIVTEHPVEKGSKITDHYRKDPETLRITLFFSGSPLRGDLDDDYSGSIISHPMKQGTYPPGAPPYTPGGLLQLAGKGLTAVGGALGLGAPPAPTSIAGFTFDLPPIGRYAKALNTIRRLQTQGILVAAKTSTERIENLAILGGAGHRNEQTGDGAELELNFKEIRFVTSDVSFGTPTPVEPRAIPKKSNLNAGASETTGATQTALKKIQNSFAPHLFGG